MDKKILEDIISAEAFTPHSVEELTKELDKEVKKPNPDYDLVDELTAAILEAEGSDIKIDASKTELEAIREKAKKRKPKCPKWAVAASAACLALMIANIFSVSALGMNIFSAAIEITKSGFVVDFEKMEQEKNKIILPASDEDPYGMIAKLAEYDINFETPHYIPEGFVLTDLSTNVNEEYANTVSFIYWNGKKSIRIDFIRYHNEVGKIGIPSDHYNISEREVNGALAVVSKEDNQYTITYEKNKIAFFMSTTDVPYDECEKIVDSIK